MEEKPEDDATERIEEAFSRGDDKAAEPGTYEKDRPVHEEPQSRPDLEEAKEEGGGNEPGLEPEEQTGNVP